MSFFDSTPPVSPTSNKSKITTLQKRVASMEGSSSSLKTKLEDKYKKTNELFFKVRGANDQNLSLIGEELKQLQTALDSETTLRELLKNRIEKESQMVYTGSLLSLLLSKKELAELSRDRAQMIEEQSNLFLRQLEDREEHLRDENQTFNEPFYKSLNDAKQQIQTLKEEREKNLDTLSANVTAELAGVEAGIKELRKERERRMADIMQRADALLKDFQRQIQLQKIEREKSESSLFQLFSSTPVI